MTETPASLAGSEARNASPGSPESLEQRLRRLEDAVAELQDTQKLEERISERVADRVGRGGPASFQESAGLIVEAGRRLIPAAVGMITDSAAPPPLASPVLPPPPQPLLGVEVFEDIRTIFRMYLDRRFRLTWSGRVIPLTALILIVVSWLLLSWIYGPLIDRIVELVLVLIAGKVLCREARRYRETVLGLQGPSGS